MTMTVDRKVGTGPTVDAGGAAGSAAAASGKTKRHSPLKSNPAKFAEITKRWGFHANEDTSLSGH